MTRPFARTPDSATIGTTEYFLASDSTTATYQTTATRLRGWIDLSAMIAGDEYQITIYEKVNGSAAKIAYGPAFVNGVQSPPIWDIPEVWVKEGWEVGVKKIAGTDRAIGWALDKDTGDVNVTEWLAGTPDALSSGKVPADLKLWLTVAPDAIVSGAVRAHVESFDGGAITTAAFAAGAINAAALAADAVDEIWDEAHEGSETVRQALRLIRSVIVGKASGLLTNFTSRDIADTKSRVLHTMGGGGDTRTPTTDAT